MYIHVHVVALLRTLWLCRADFYFIVYAKWQLHDEASTAIAHKDTQSTKQATHEGKASYNF